MSSLNQYFEQMDGRQRLFALTFTLSLVAVLVTLFIKDIWSTILICIFILATFWVASRIWLPEEYGRYRIARYSLWIILAVATASPLWLELVLTAVWPYMHELFPHLSTNLPSIATTTSISFVFVLAGVFIVNYFMRPSDAVQTEMDRDTPATQEDIPLSNVFCG